MRRLKLPIWIPLGGAHLGACNLNVRFQIQTVVEER